MLLPEIRETERQTCRVETSIWSPPRARTVGLSGRPPVSNAVGSAGDGGKLQRLVQSWMPLRAV